MKPRPLLLLLLSLQLLAFWPVGRWYVARVADGSDEPWGLLALATAAAWLCWHGWQRRDADPALWHGRQLWPAIAATLLYAFCYGSLPPLLSAALACLALTLLVSPLLLARPLHPALLGLLLLALPLMASLQFYAGYPLRVLVAQLTCPLLQAAGHVVVREGAALRFGEQTIWVDAPCSGIRMLWAGGYLVCTLACVWGLNWWRTVLAGVLGLALVLAGNVLRAAGLFFLEVTPLQWPPWAHTALGLVSFALVLGPLVWLVQRLERRAGRLLCVQH